MVAKKISIFEM